MADDDTAATGRDGLEEESSASKESVTIPQSSTNTAADEGTSPRSSPKRKPIGLDSDGKGPQRRKTDRKPTLKTWLLNSLKRKGRRKDNAAAYSRRSVDLETSDFSFHQPSRVSPVVRKKGSPSLELHKTFKRHSFVDVQTVKAAIQEGVDGLPSEIRGGTPLHYYVWTDSVKKDKTDFLVSLLTTAEVEVDCRTEDGNTPLHLAVKKGDVEAVKVLIAFGASVNTCNNRGQTPLDIATLSYLQQEKKVNTSPHRRGLDWQSRRPTHHRSTSSHLHHADSPLLSKIIPRRPKFSDSDLDGDLEGWVSVDFTDSPPVADRHVSARKEVRLQDLTDPVNIMMEEKTTEEEQKEGSSSSSVHRQVSTPKNRVRSSTLQEDELLRRAFDDTLNLLHATGAMSRHKLQQSSSKPISLSGLHIVPDLSMELQRSIRLSEYEEGSTILNLYEALEDTINRKMEELSWMDDLDENAADKAIALALQQSEMRQYNKTLHRCEAEEVVEGGGRAKAGIRVLCLDGGGIRGLLQIEILSQIERVSGRKIVDLFDWIIGTSSGALIALALIYGEKSLEEVRYLYFKMKNEVFTGGNYGFNTVALERLLKEAFPPHMTMNCPTTNSINVLVSAVHKKNTPPDLHFFNNCFGDQFSTQKVWKVARYTTAAPMFFKECDDYVDGGVLANNPSETGLTAVQEYFHSRGLPLSIAIVVSVGTGIYPAEELGRIDLQDFMFFGKQWLSFQDTVKTRAMNLIQLLSNALVESETVAMNTKARCESQGIPYYRFSPKLAENVATGETDNKILINMLLSTIVQTVPRMEDIRIQFSRIAEATQKERFRKRRAL